MGMFTQTTHQAALETAQRAVQDAAVTAGKSSYRHNYHFMAPANWINDPNGFIYYKSEYHMFYQHNPFEPTWGSIHWGHAKSKDLLHWEHLPIALAPTEAYDRSGCFSGNAFVWKDRLYLFYTGTYRINEQYVQCQCMAYSDDGIHFTKSKDNPILAAPPAHCNFNFRDPYVCEHDGTVYMLVGSSMPEGFGCILVYTADDDTLAHWTFRNNLTESRGELGDTWECPCLRPFGAHDVLFVSSQRAGLRKSSYLLGKTDYEACRHYWYSMDEIDWGFDYYAPQVIPDGNGRYVMMGWMSSWHWMRDFTGRGLESEDSWSGAMALPRTARLAPDQTHLLFEPVEELKTCRRNGQIKQDITVSEKEYEIPSERISSTEFIVNFNKNKTTASECGVIIRNQTGELSRLYWDKEHGLLVIERIAENGVYQKKSVDFNTIDFDTVDLRIFIDTCSVEIFALNGKVSFSYRLYTGPGTGGCYLYAKGGSACIQRLESYTLSL